MGRPDSNLESTHHGAPPGADSPSRAELRAALAGRMGEDAVTRLESATVGVAGLGGLGSQIAIALARTGVGRLRLVDFDAVDITNLNRQAYELADMGRPKTEVMAEKLARINPWLDVRATTVRITPDNATALFADCEIVCEAFDDPAAKAMLTETLLAEDRDVRLVGANGMAGFDRTDSVRVRRVGSRWWVCGDETSDIATGAPLVAPRVLACAGAQAMQAVRLVLGLEEPGAG